VQLKLSQGDRLWLYGDGQPKVPRPNCRSTKLGYIRSIVSRSPRGRPTNAPTAFIHPCQPTVADRPPRGEGWVHELKHDGYW